MGTYESATPPGPGSAFTSAKSRPHSTASSNAGADEATSAEYDHFVLGTEVQGDENILDCYQPFDKSMVRKCLSQLSRTASSIHAAYLRLELTGTDLDDPQAIAHCRCLQHVVLPNNQLTTLKALEQLQQLTSLDASHNQLTEVLHFDSASSKQDVSNDADETCSSNLRTADLSYNLIREIRDLSRFRRLNRLVLDGNQIERIGNGLKQLQTLQHLSLTRNKISSCRGLEGLTSLRELAVDGNRLSSLAPLAGLTGLEVLLAAHNQLRDCEGVQGLSSLRRLDLRSNQLRRLEVLAPCQGLGMLGDFDVADNPLEAGQNIRLYIISLLPQVCLLNGAAVSYTEKVDAANMAGAAAEGLMAIRRQYFPAGELDDGGGAVPPTAAGLTPSRAEEELSCNNADSMFEAIDSWARAVHPSTALGTAAVAAAGSGAAAVGLLSAEPSSKTAGSAPPTAVGRLTRKSVSGIARSSSTSRRTSLNTPRVDALGAAAVAGKLAAGCSRSEPWAQLQLARACYSWVVWHARLPFGCSIEAGAELHTWDVGIHLFGEDEQQIQWHQALLPGHSGTYAECVSQALVQLYHAVHMEAVQLSGFWKAGGQHSVGPGGKLAAHNHSWVAVKVNGRWRLLDSVYAILRRGELPFYLPPEAFIYTHLPFEGYWQLLPNPVSKEQWWQMPEVALPFFAAGGQLLDEQLQSHTVLPACREGQVLPSLKIPVAAPASQHQYVCLKLLDQHRQLLASWNNSTQQQQGSTTAKQQQQAAPGHGVDGPLVYQQHLLSSGGQKQVLVGHIQKQVSLQELWVSFPAPGVYYVHVELVSETPDWLRLSVAGLADPLQISYWRREDILRVKVVVPPVLPHDPADGICVSPVTPVAVLPRPEAVFHSCGGLQLITPQPSKLLEADRPELFEVVAPAATAVAVGSEEVGWQELQLTAAEQQDQQQQQLLGTFRGHVIIPRLNKCFVAVKLAEDLQLQQADGSGWLPVISLRVVPQVQHLIEVPDPAPLQEPDPMDPVLPRLRKLLAGLDVDGDGVASRKDLLLAFRRDRQLADHLRMQPRVKVDDGSFDKFLDKFKAINKDGLGYIDLKQLYAYLANLTGADSSSSRLGTTASARLVSAGGSGRPPRGDSAGSTASAHSTSGSVGHHMPGSRLVG